MATPSISPIIPFGAPASGANLNATSDRVVSAARNGRTLANLAKTVSDTPSAGQLAVMRGTAQAAIDDAQAGYQLYGSFVTGDTVTRHLRGIERQASELIGILDRAPDGKTIRDEVAWRATGIADLHAVGAENGLFRRAIGHLANDRKEKGLQYMGGFNDSWFQKDTMLSLIANDLMPGRTFPEPTTIGAPPQ